MRRYNDGKQYFVFPGGSVEEGETIEQAAMREAAEELSLSIKLGKELTRFAHKGREEVYYLVDDFDGEPMLGGEEKERMNENNQYHLEWKNKELLINSEPFYPTQIKQKVIGLLETLG